MRCVNDEGMPAFVYKKRQPAMSLAALRVQAEQFGLEFADCFATASCSKSVKDTLVDVLRDKSS